MLKPALLCLLSMTAFSAIAAAQPGAGPAPEALDWKTLERPLMRHHVQLTTREAFVKAGEAYFSPDGQWVVFQAVPVPEEGQEADPFYAMYIARLKRDRFTGLVSGLEQVTRVSPEGSANTCGWFMPGTREGHEPLTVMFGSTLRPPDQEQKSGFQVGTRRYVWMFPQEMEVVTAVVTPVFDTGAAKPSGWSAQEPAAVFTRPNYDAECSVSPDGRFLLYAHVEDHEPGAKPDANIYIFDTRTGQHRPIVTATGYEGGPFFSPDGRSICYRSDRRGDDRLQLYVADLRFESGVPVGLEREYQLTDNEHVNWCPYWHPSGKYLVYGTSEVSHGNYEVFAVESDMQALRQGKDPSTLKRVRVTQAGGADILPAFSPDGTLMMWTSQRGPAAEGEEKPSSQLWLAEWTGDPMERPAYEPPAGAERHGGGEGRRP